jgi:carbonic anhydrase
MIGWGARHRARIGLAAVASLTIGLVLATPAQGFQWPAIKAKAEAPHWGYTGDQGPSHWGEIAPEFATCKDGQAQSPIDISYGRRADFQPLSFQYRSDALAVTNNGHGIQVDSGPGSFLLIDGHEFALKEFHFHTPSEHSIQGVKADMELHLVHRDAKGKTAVVAVLLQGGRRINSVLKRIVESMPAVPGESFYGRQVAINPVFLLPQDRSYFYYPGSLTTPPCSEGVDWLVMSQPVEVDASLIAAFRQVMGANARPAQPDNARPIFLFSRR